MTISILNCTSIQKLERKRFYTIVLNIVLSKGLQKKVSVSRLICNPIRRPRASKRDLGPGARLFLTRPRARLFLTRPRPRASKE